MTRIPLPSHPAWETLAEPARERLLGHGDYRRWRQALGTLPELVPEGVLLSDVVTAVGPASTADQQRLRDALKALHPWRKGPFELFGVRVDSEWRSDWKWQRIAPALGPLDGLRVLDVGCGNGYFGWRALEAGAEEVVGVDPSVLFYMQHAAVSSYLNRVRSWPNYLLPLPFEVVPEVQFDLVTSMGVIYHRPQPAAHVERLYRFTRPGGRVLLESLVVEAEQGLDPSTSPAAVGRYARMRNISTIPSVDLLVHWLRGAGFRNPSLVDATATTTDEQRSTDWMTFESLREALDPTDPGKTVEGFPAPVRAAVLAHKA